jgi:hypothetical protein
MVAQIFLFLNLLLHSSRDGVIVRGGPQLV